MTVFQINVSGGGVPKRPVPRAEVTATGLAADAQTHTKIHGGPDRALCLWSLERILALQQEGHPIVPGAAGENLTLTGLDWDRVGPGLRLRLGAEVEIEVLSYTQPCGTIAGCFSDRRQSRIEQEKHPGWSRVYARVLRTGTIGRGDEVQIIGDEPKPSTESEAP